MSSSLISAWKKNIFSSPFFAGCQSEGETETPALAVNEERTIAAAATVVEVTEMEGKASPELSEAAIEPATEPASVPETVSEPESPSQPVSEPPPVAADPNIVQAQSVAQPVETPEITGKTKQMDAGAVVSLEPVKPVVLPGYVRDKARSIAKKMDSPGGEMVSLTTIPCNSSVTNRYYEENSCEFGSGKYYAYCAFGGLLSCGLTHTAVVPLDLVKCRIQVDAAKYGNIIKGFRVTLAEEGVRALGKGWAPTFFGYSMQGVGKFGFYEAFKIFYSGMMGDENTYLWRTSLYLAASASAEFFADIALCPMEAVKVRIQTQPGWSSTLREGFPRILQEEGISGFYKGLVPLWARQIPYTMMKFACFERTVEALYKNVVPKPRNECSKSEQLVVTFAAGYIAGVFCAIVSHPADTIVSKLNQAKGSNFVQIAQKLGFMGMWKGLFPRIIMIGTLTALQWFIYDSVKVAFRLPRPPPPEMPESLKRKMGIA